MKNKAFVKGAAILIAFNLIGKLVGAIYRIPLANLLGAEGIGKYQLVFPLYSLLLAISVSGIPIAISKIVAEYNGKGQFGDAKKLLKLAIFYLFIVSLFCFAIVLLCSKFIARIQGNPDIYFCYYGIAPAILFVGILSVFRGYFQGNLKMLPTAISGFIEQLGKLVFGLIFSTKLIKFGINYGVLGALIGISISELLSLIFLTIYYFVYAKKHKMSPVALLGEKTISKQLFTTAVPITLGGLASPITNIIDSLLVVNLLIFSGLEANVATSYLGLQSGIVDPLINIPIVIAVSISASLLPNLASENSKGNVDEVKSLVEKAFQITLSVALVCSICFVIFGKQILSFLYGKTLSVSEVNIAVKLLFLGGFNLIFLSLVQVSTGVLQGINKQNLAVKSLLIGSGIKIVLTIMLVSFKPINILGAMMSGGVSYFVVFLINYSAIKRETEARISNVFLGISVQECLVGLFAFFTNLLVTMSFGLVAGMFVGGVTAIIVFMVTYYVLFLIQKPSVVSS